MGNGRPKEKGMEEAGGGGMNDGWSNQARFVCQSYLIVGVNHIVTRLGLIWSAIHSLGILLDLRENALCKNLFRKMSIVSILSFIGLPSLAI